MENSHFTLNMDYTGRKKQALVCWELALGKPNLNTKILEMI